MFTRPPTDCFPIVFPGHKRLLQHPIGKKKRPQTQERVEDVIVRGKYKINLETPLSPNAGRE
jgi:hypothetical protein